MGQKKSWSDDELVGLIRAKKAASCRHVPGETAKKFALRVKAHFDDLISPNERGVSAVEEKLSILMRIRRRLYDFQSGKLPGSTGRPPFFSLPLGEQRTFFKGLPMVSETVGKVLLQEFPVDVTMEPLTIVEAGIKIEAVVLSSDSECLPTSSCTKRTPRSNEQQLIHRLELEGERNRAVIQESTAALISVLKEFLDRNI